MARSGRRALFDLALEARDAGARPDRAPRHRLRPEAHRPPGGRGQGSDLRWMDEEAEASPASMNYPHAELLSAAEPRAKVDTPYHGALFDPLGGHMHPLNYTLGLAGAAAGGRGRHPREFGRRGCWSGACHGVRVSTAKGAVRARHAVLAGDALLQGLERGSTAASCRSPTTSSPPSRWDAGSADPPRCRGLRQPLRGQLLPPVRRRPAAVRRRRALHADSAGRHRRLRAAAYGRDFPQLRGCRIDHAWGGLVSVTTAACRMSGAMARSVRPRLFRHGRDPLDARRKTARAEAIGESPGFDLFTRAAPHPSRAGPTYVPCCTSWECCGMQRSTGFLDRRVVMTRRR